MRAVATPVEVASAGGECESAVRMGMAPVVRMGLALPTQRLDHSADRCEGEDKNEDLHETGLAGIAVSRPPEPDRDRR